MTSDDFERHPLFFLGCTWDNAEDWNDADSWADAYPDDLSELDPDQLGVEGLELSWASASLLERLASEEGLPRGPGEPALQVLDAGCGWANLPYAVARMGCDVMAIDFAAKATRLNEALLPHRMRWPLAQDLVESLGDRASRIGLPGAPTGSVTHRTLDWFDDALAPGSFQAIYACDSLRLSRKPYWRRSLARFADLLAPGGLLIVLCQNARAIRREVGELAKSVGFQLVSDERAAPQESPRRPEEKRFVGIWPTG